MAPSTTAAAIAATAAAAAYLDAKFHIRKDLGQIARAKRGERLYAKAVKANKSSPYYLFEARSHLFPNALAIWSRTGNYTWSQVYDRTCQYATFFLSQGVQPGQNIALYMQNAPEFMFLWLGLLAIGSAPAMVNWNLGADPLVHCVKLSGAKLLIADEEEGCQERINSERRRLEEDIQLKIITLSEELKSQIANLQVKRPDDTYRDGLKTYDPIALIYTSGTTGLPKLFPVTADRISQYAAPSPPTLNQKPGPGGDRWYNCMPLYHGTGGITALVCLLTAVSLAIGKKFSTTNFWNDVRDSESTFMVYVGETARYLLAAPPSPLDKQHKLRCMYGNGMRPDVWKRFKERFGVPEVLEFFTSTEGMFALNNYSTGPFTESAIGHHGLILRRFFHKTYVPVEIDTETGDIYRSPITGFAKRKSYAEGGEIIVKAASQSDWPGYWQSPEDTARKFARDVFEKGDIYYRTGDALKRDDDGKWFFIDRLGDTYRWKSENVSTAEVAEKLGKFPGVLEANVYGVTVPEHEGKAGCATLSLDPSVLDNFDWKTFVAFARAELPSFAVPIFIRLMAGEVGRLSSHNNKQNKVPLRAEGVDPKLKGTKVAGGEADKMLWLPAKSSEYVPFTDADWNSLVASKAKL